MRLFLMATTSTLGATSCRPTRGWTVTTNSEPTRPSGSRASGCPWCAMARSLWTRRAASGARWVTGRCHSWGRGVHAPDPEHGDLWFCFSARTTPLEAWDLHADGGPASRLRWGDFPGMVDADVVDSEVAALGDGRLRIARLFLVRKPPPSSRGHCSPAATTAPTSIGAASSPSKLQLRSICNLKISITPTCKIDRTTLITKKTQLRTTCS
jgi:hypothetical protein